MAQRQAPQESFYHGLDLDYAPFDRKALMHVIDQTRLPPAIGEGSARDALLDQMNTLAVALDHHLQLARSPSPTDDKRELKAILGHIERLRGAVPVVATLDHGIAPSVEPRVADGLLRLLAPEMEARLAGDKPISGWKWTLAPDNHFATPTASLPSVPPSTHASPDDTMQTPSEADHGMPSDADGAYARPIPDYDPGEAVSFFGADNPNDILVMLNSVLALIEDSGRSVLAELGEPERAERGTPERQFVFSLIPLYCELFERPAATSFDNSERTPGGPLIRFLTACLAFVAPRGARQLTANTLKQYVQEYRTENAGD